LGYCRDDTLPPVEKERCPHCGGMLRVRAKDLRRAIDIMNQWIAEQEGRAMV
jgi:hypothetical protein